MKIGIEIMESDDQLALALKEAANIIRNARVVLVTAGAGMGVDAGLHIYRSVIYEKPKT